MVLCCASAGRATTESTMNTVREYRIMIHLPLEDWMKLCPFGARVVFVVKGLKIGLTRAHQRLPLSPEGAHLSLVGGAAGLAAVLAVHAPGDVRPRHTSAGAIPGLARLERLEIIRRREAPRALEGAEVLQATRTPGRPL